MAVLKTLIALATCGLALGLSACTPAGSGPLEVGGSPGTLCVPGEPGRDVGIGNLAILGGDDAVIVKRVELVSQTNLELSHAYILPVGAEEPLGSFYPDREESDSWAGRISVTKRTIEPGETVNIVVVVSRAGDSDGTASMVRITYDAHGTQYEAATSTEIEIRARCD